MSNNIYLMKVGLIELLKRLTVFIKSDSDWKWLAHANLIAIKSKAK